jgi:hypothetical protein
MVRKKWWPLSSFARPYNAGAGFDMTDNAWWPLKWMFLLVAVFLGSIANPQKDRELWGALGLSVVAVLILPVLARDLVKLHRKNELRARRVMRAVTATLAVAAIALALRHWLLINI